MQKTCYQCKITQSRDNFYKCNNKIDGLQGMCKSCNAKRFKTYYVENREKYLAYDKAWRMNNPEKYLQKIKRAKKLRQFSK